MSFISESRGERAISEKVCLFLGLGISQTRFVKRNLEHNNAEKWPNLAQKQLIKLPNIFISVTFIDGTEIDTLVYTLSFIDKITQFYPKASQN